MFIVGPRLCCLTLSTKRRVVYKNCRRHYKVILALERKRSPNIAFSAQFAMLTMMEKEKGNFVVVFLGWQVKCVYNHLSFEPAAGGADEMQGC